MNRWDDQTPSRGLCYRARVEPRDIQYLCDIIEGHEGLGIVRTIDRRDGIVEIWFSPLMREEIDDFLRSLTCEMEIRIGPLRRLDAEGNSHEMESSETSGAGAARV